MPTCDTDECDNEAVARCPVCASIFCDDDSDGEGHDCPDYRCSGVLEDL